MIPQTIDKEKLLKEYHDIIKILNRYYENNITFTKTELLKNYSNDRQLSLITKGIILTLIKFDYIKIVSKIGNYNYLYEVKKEIK